MILTILAIPVILALLAQLIRDRRAFSILNIFGHAATLGLCLRLTFDFASGKIAQTTFSIFYLDSLSAFFLTLTGFIAFCAALYSHGYIKHEVNQAIITERKARGYYSLFNLFVFTMLVVPSVANLGLVWAAIEMTTLVSAFLVGFHNSRHSVEAAWKYIIICSVGISLALLGIILLYYTVLLHGASRTLDWTTINTLAVKLDPKILKIAFVFIFIGFGTKAGIAPMHNWLPDAHSQSPSPISAMLSGVLLKASLYAVIRVFGILSRAGQAQFCQSLFIFFGLLSLGLAAGFILAQKDIKRLLAYSSVEHVGICLLGLGFGPLAALGALLHIANHAATKSLMFFGAGNVVALYGTNNKNLIRGVINTLPFTGIMLLLGSFALAGSPPFSVFLSELWILNAGFSLGKTKLVALALLFMAIAFAGIIMHFSRIIFGRKPENIAAEPEPWSAKLAFIALLGPMLVFGLYLPNGLQKFLGECTRIIFGT
jgi:hydrogenase-4 component F